ncbi:flagellar basal body rod protein FlgC [Roseibacterium sp. SDUM158017]|uniref:flagellar basal body rod protein FlgC n=1 Tax=Roseicyclus salinarum TaxID=3036773 RepID=UPI002414F1ED|nr:flagellar basal body rod protein FlgC [Roseibacterium sp. SDUM158017]MDG4648623.1 flagellar basal body rod protein FlgC [Roseibacterium sp. SDUM158017]
MDPLRSISSIAASGMLAQSHRLKVTAENVANANSTGNTPTEEPYRRKTITFAELLDRESGASMVQVEDIGRDASDFPLRYDPAHPAANEEGYVRTPNVSAILEMNNMREAARSYEANMNMYEAARTMRRQMLDLLK